MSGIIQKIALLGREFTIQTEYVPGPDGKIRTLAYDGGRLVTKREVDLDPTEETDGLLDDRIREHHQRITERLYRRAAKLQEAKAVTSVPPVVERFTAPPPASVAKRRPRPTVEAGSRLETAIATRQTIGPFSLTFSRPAPDSAEEYESLLETAENLIDGIMKTPTYDRIRIDEQLTFIAIRGQLATWRLSKKNTSVAAEIWPNIERFAHHLKKINDRNELVTFDHELLTWAMSELGHDALSDELIDRLQDLAGRDTELDNLLAQPGEINQHGLLEVLMGLLDRTLA
jgi:hypothetical protein